MCVCVAMRCALVVDATSSILMLPDQQCKRQRGYCLRCTPCTHALEHNGRLQAANAAAAG